MPEFLSVQGVRLHAQNYYVFLRNADDLISAVAIHSDPEHALNLWQVDNRYKLSAFQREVGRLLHNFVASASTLIDTTRVLYNKYGAARFSDYQPRIDSEFAPDPLARFVVCLRQYAVHYAAPPLGSVLTMTQETGISNALVLPASVLLEFSGWDSHSKSYIATSGDNVIVDAAVSTYFETVRSFYDWFYARIFEITQPEQALVAAKREELRRAHYSSALMFIESGLGHVSEGNRYT